MIFKILNTMVNWKLLNNMVNWKLLNEMCNSKLIVVQDGTVTSDPQCTVAIICFQNQKTKARINIHWQVTVKKNCTHTTRTTDNRLAAEVYVLRASAFTCFTSFISQILRPNPFSLHDFIGPSEISRLFW